MDTSESNQELSSNKENNSNKDNAESDHKVNPDEKLFKDNLLSELNQYGSKNLELSVFISYSRENDRVVTGLLAQALSKQGFKTLLDRRLYPGANITNTICKQISEAHAVILVLSEKSISSPWVNQELGYARALDKPIIPIQIEKHIQNSGMFIGTNELDFDTDWFNHETSIQKLTNDIYRAIDEKDTPAVIIKSKKNRAARITETFNQLNALLKKDKNKNMILRLYKRTQTSIFSVGSSMKDSPTRYDPNYSDLLIKQRRSMENFIKNNQNVKVRLLLNIEERNYDQAVEKNRLKSLHEFITDVTMNKDLNKRILFHNEKHDQSNIIALENHFIFEGLKLKSTLEYLYTLHWKYPSNKFHQFFSHFDDTCYWKTAEYILKYLDDFIREKNIDFSDVEKK